MEEKKFKCGHSELLEQIEIRYYRGKLQRIFRDERGRKRRQRSQCYDCYMTDLRKKRGTKPRLDSDSPIIKSAVRAEKIAAEHFRSIGWSVEHGHGAGPDLIISGWAGGSARASVEVKQAFRGTRCWLVPFVKPNRRSDDFVAIVLPNGKVIVEKMSEHLSKCGNYGNRAVTAMVKQFGLDPQPK